MGRPSAETQTCRGQPLPECPRGARTPAPGHTHRSNLGSVCPAAAMRSGVPGRQTHLEVYHVPRRPLLRRAHKPTDMLTGNKLTTTPKPKPGHDRGAQPRRVG